MQEKDVIRTEDELKALTVTQPWASLIAFREKTIESRSWSTSYRGELVIHAAKGFPVDAQNVCRLSDFAKALQGLTATELPLSRGLCIVRVLACLRTTELHKVREVLGHMPTTNEIVNTN